MTKCKNTTPQPDYVAAADAIDGEATVAVAHVEHVEPKIVVDHTTPILPVLDVAKAMEGKYHHREGGKYLHDFYHGLTQEQLQHIVSYGMWEVGHRQDCDINCYEAAKEEYIAATEEALREGWLARVPDADGKWPDWPTDMEFPYDPNERLRGAQSNLQWYFGKMHRTRGTSEICQRLQPDDYETLKALRAGAEDEAEREAKDELEQKVREEFHRRHETLTKWHEFTHKIEREAPPRPRVRPRPRPRSRHRQKIIEIARAVHAARHHTFRR